MINTFFEGIISAIEKTLRTLALILILSCAIYAQMEAPRKTDEFARYTCDELMMRADNLEAELAKTPDVRAYIIAYEGKYQTYKDDRNGKSRLTYILPRVGEVQARIAVIKRIFLLRHYSLKPLTFIIGGFREHHSFEFWVTAPGGKAPPLSPTLRKMKFRKGKAPKIAFLGCNI